MVMDSSVPDLIARITIEDEQFEDEDGNDNADAVEGFGGDVEYYADDEVGEGEGGASPRLGHADSTDLRFAEDGLARVAKPTLADEVFRPIDQYLRELSLPKGEMIGTVRIAVDPSDDVVVVTHTTAAEDAAEAERANTGSEEAVNKAYTTETDENHEHGVHDGHGAHGDEPDKPGVVHEGQNNHDDEL